MSQFSPLSPNRRLREPFGVVLVLSLPTGPRIPALPIEPWLDSLEAERLTVGLVSGIVPLSPYLVFRPSWLKT